MNNRAIGLFSTILVSLSLLGCNQREQPSTQPQPGKVDRERLLNAGSKPENWLTSGRNFKAQHYSPLAQINTSNVEQLGFAWEYKVDPRRGRPLHGLQATPLVIDGVMYTSGPWARVFAVEAKTGKEIWRYDPPIMPGWGRRICCSPVNRGVAVWKGLVYVGTTDGHLAALDAATGKEIWKVDTFVNRTPFYSITSAPFVAGDNIVIGNSGADFGVRGYVSAYHYKTGKLAWRFYTVPGDPQKGFEHPEMEVATKTWSPDSEWESGGGGTAWGHMAYDPELNLLYVGTGNSSPYPNWIRSPGGGDNLYLSSILAINPDTGRLVWHYQTTPGESWDYTSTQNMIMAELDVKGKKRKVLMQAPKNGFFYVLDRETGELLSAENYVKVNWASHIDLDTGRPVLTGQADYQLEPKIVFPSTTGGHNWMPMAFSPKSGLVYIPAIEKPGLYAAAEDYQYNPKGWNTGTGAASAEFLEEFSTLYKKETHEVLKAWDPVTQQEVWRTPAGEHFRNGGVLATAGDLVIQGTAKGYLNIYHANTGALLKAIHIGTGIMAGAMSFSLEGEQYIAVMAGYGGAVVAARRPAGTAPYQYQNLGRIIALKLGGSEVPLPPATVIADIPEPPPMQGSNEDIAKGQTLFGQYCMTCHAGFGEHLSAYPRLDRMPLGMHSLFKQIVLEGLFSNAGMASFADTLNEKEVESIHAYLIAEQHKLIKGKNKDPWTPANDQH